MSEFWKKISNGDIRNILAIIVTLGSFSLLYVLQIKAIPVDNKDVVNIAIGSVIGGALTMVLGFYFGGNKTDKTNE